MSQTMNTDCHEPRSRSAFLAWRLTGALAASAIFFGCASYFPGEKAYWDSKIKEMCERDGGVVIYQKIRIAKSAYDKLPRVGSYVGVPPRSLARHTDVLVVDEATTVLNNANPRVWRTEQLVTRVSDGTLIAKVVRYSRVGGDVPSPSHSSHFACPAEKALLAAQQAIFLVEPSK